MKIALITLVVVFFVFLVADISWAQSPPPTSSSPSSGLWDEISKWVTAFIVKFIVFMISTLTYLTGKLLILLMEIVVWLSLYNKFTDNPYVNQGWVILRDLVNMFFILGLLFIAFITVLKLDRNEWSKLLGKLLIMAVLVNFSKSVVGLIIDFFQVIMITFVNAYRNITAGNLFYGLQVDMWFKLDQADKLDWKDGMAAIAASLLTLIFCIVSVVVVGIFCIILAFRIVALWILVVFSPLAFFAWVFQGRGGKVGSMANQWWTQFFNYCMVGPLLAFFLWISVITIKSLSIGDGLSGMVPQTTYDRTKMHDPQATIGVSGVGNMDGILKMMIAMVIMVAGLKFSGEFGTVGGGLAARAAGKMQNMAQGTLEGAANKGWRAATYLPREAYGRGKRAAGAYVGGAYEGIKGGLADRLATRMEKGKQRGGVSGALMGAAGSGVGMIRKGLYLGTEQGAKEEREMMAGRARSFIGPAKKEKEAAQRPAIDNRKKLMDKEVNWENKEEVAAFANKSIEQGDFITAKAALEKTAESKHLEKDMLNGFNRRFVGKGKQYTGEDDASFVEFTSGLEKTHEKATGRMMPINSFFVDEGGNVQMREDWDPHSEIMTKYGQKTVSERKNIMDDKSAFDIRGAGGPKEKRDRLSHMFAAAKDHRNFGNMSQSGRDNFSQAAEYLMASDEGKQLMDEYLKGGQIDEKDLDNMSNAYKMANAKYTSEINGTVEGGTENLDRFLSKEQKSNLDILADKKSDSKTGLGRYMGQSNVVSGTDKVSTDSSDEIAATMGTVDIDEKKISRSLSAANQAKVKDQTQKAKKEQTAIIKDATLTSALEKMRPEDQANEAAVKEVIGSVDIDDKAIRSEVAAANPKLSGRKFEKKVKEAVQQKIDQRYRQFKQGKLSKSTMQERATKFVVKYGTAEEKGKTMSNSIENKTYDDKMADLDKVNSNDMADMGRINEELKTLEEQTSAQFKRTAEKLDIKLDPDYAIDQKKLQEQFKIVAAAKTAAARKQALEDLKEKLNKVRDRRKNETLKSGYMYNEWQKRQIRSLMAQNDKLNVRLIAKVQEKMRGKDYYSATEVTKAYKEALAELGGTP